MTVVRQGLALVVGGVLVFFGVTKFTEAGHIFSFIEYRATELGLPFADLFYPLANWATGVLEIVAGIMTILPATRVLGARLSIVPLLGAVVFHLSPLLGVATVTGYADPAPRAALAAGGPFTRADFAAETSPALFSIAAAVLALALLNAWVNRRS